jgi:hypothetical protein
MFAWIVLAAAVAMLFGADRAAGQGCCSPGSPATGGLETGASASGQLQIIPSINFITLGSAWSGSQRVEDELDRRIDAWNYALDVQYGLTSRLSLLLSMNYSARSRELSATTGDGAEIDFDAETSGFGDLVALAKFQLLGWDLASQSELDLGAGAKLPTGAHDLYDNGVKVSRDLLPGSGAYHFLVWSYFYKSFRPSPIGLSVSGYYDHPGVSDDGYQFGREINYTAGVIYQTNGSLDLVAQFAGRWAGADEYQGRELPSTGGNWLYAQPGLGVRLSLAVSIQLSAQIPIYRDLNGTQLAPSVGFQLAGVFAVGGE